MNHGDEATVLTCTRDADVTVTVLRLDQEIAQPVAPASLRLCDGGGQSAPVMDLHKVISRVGSELTFETYGSKSQPPMVGGKYRILSWWGSSQLDLAQSDAPRWQRRAFVPSDAVVFRRTDGRAIVHKLEEGEAVAEGAELLRDGWEHEHCHLCWSTISVLDCDERVGYTDGREWLCEECYQKYVASGFGKKLGGITWQSGS